MNEERKPPDTINESLSTSSSSSKGLQTLELGLTPVLLRTRSTSGMKLPVDTQKSSEKVYDLQGCEHNTDQRREKVINRGGDREKILPSCDTKGDVCEELSKTKETCYCTSTSNNKLTDEKSLDNVIPPGNNGTSQTLEHFHHSLPLWVESEDKANPQVLLSPDLFKPCTDNMEEVDFPVPLTRLEKESRRIARKRHLEAIKTQEQTEQRKMRFLKRQKRLDDDDGVPVIDDRTVSDDTISPPKSKKRVMWEEEKNLVEFHIYSPVTVEDREVTPVVNS